MEITVGQKYAYREHIGDYDERLQAVKVVKKGPPRSGKVRIQYLDGEYEGLDVWVPQRRLLSSWETAGDFCRDERCVLAAEAASGIVKGTIPYSASEMVFGTVADLHGKEYVLLGWRAIEEDLVIIQDFDNAVRALHLDQNVLLEQPYAFVDRFGDYKAPFQVAENLAKMFCQRFPNEVLQDVQTDKNKIRQKEMSNSHSSASWSKYLASQKHAIILVKEWCGEQAVEKFNEATVLREEVHRLRSLIESVTQWLENAGHQRKASSILRELNKSTHE